MWRHWEKTVIFKPRREASEETTLLTPWSWTFQPPELWKNYFLLFKPISPWHFVMAALERKSGVGAGGEGREIKWKRRQARGLVSMTTRPWGLMCAESRGQGWGASQTVCFPLSKGPYFQARHCLEIQAFILRSVSPQQLEAVATLLFLSPWAAFWAGWPWDWIDRKAKPQTHNREQERYQEAGENRIDPDLCEF